MESYDGILIGAIPLRRVSYGPDIVPPVMRRWRASMRLGLPSAPAETLVNLRRAVDSVAVPADPAA